MQQHITTIITELNTIPDSENIFGNARNPEPYGRDAKSNKLVYSEEQDGSHHAAVDGYARGHPRR